VTGSARRWRFPSRRLHGRGRCGASVAGSSASPLAVPLFLSAFDTVRSAIWVTRSLPVFAAADASKDVPSRARRRVCRRPRGLPHRASHACPKARADRSRSCARYRVWPPRHSHVIAFPRRSSTYGPPRVSSPSALSDGCVHEHPAAAFASATRDCLTRYDPSPGPLTLLTVFSATTPAGLFHPAHAPGVPPFRAYSRRAGTPLDARCPPDVSQVDPPRRPLRRPTAPDHGPMRRFQRAQHRKPTRVAFRALLPSEVRDIAATG